MIVNQWVPAAHRGDAIGDSCAPRARPGAGHGPRQRHLRADDRRGHAGRDAPVRRSRGTGRRRHALPLRPALADDGGVQDRCPARPCAAVSQRHARALLRAVSSGGLPDCGARAVRIWPRWSGMSDLALGDLRRTTARNWNASGSRATGVMPIARRPRPHHARAGRIPCSSAARRRAHQLPVRRPHRPQQAHRGHRAAGRDVQAPHRRQLPLHLRRPHRCDATVLCDGPGTGGRVRHAAGPVRVCRAGAGLGAGRLLPDGQCLPFAERTRGLLRAAARGDGGRRAGVRVRRARRSPETLGGAGVSGVPRIWNTPQSCWGSWPSTRSCARRSLPASAGGWKISARPGSSSA